MGTAEQDHPKGGESAGEAEAVASATTPKRAQQKPKRAQQKRTLRQIAEERAQRAEGA